MFVSDENRGDLGGWRWYGLVVEVTEHYTIEKINRGCCPFTPRHSYLHETANQRRQGNILTNVLFERGSCLLIICNRFCLAGLMFHYSRNLYGAPASIGWEWDNARQLNLLICCEKCSTCQENINSSIMEQKIVTVIKYNLSAEITIQLQVLIIKTNLFVVLYSSSFFNFEFQLIIFKHE